MRILRHLLMLLAMLSLVGHPASAATVMHGHAAIQHAAHVHHHGVRASHSAHDEAAAGHEHRCPGHHHDGKCCDSSCCTSNCLSAAFEPILGGGGPVETAEIGIPTGDGRLDGTIPFLPDRPPITT